MFAQRLLASAAAAALIASAGHAGFQSDGWAGKGVAPMSIPAAGAAMSESQTAWLDAVKAANPGLNDADARTKANAIFQGLCKAVDLVKKEDATIGECLEKLKKKGNICVSFNMKGTAVGGARNDGKPECSENDKINVNSSKLAEGCPPPYDSALYWLATVLLHEGKHCIQDYNPDTTGLDAEKAKATKTKRALCNEGSDGAGGESKGAHVEENDWIDEIKAALEELLELDPMVDDSWSQATKDMFNGIKDLPEPARTAAIDALKKAACANKKGNDRAIECYRKAKMALMDFINTAYATPAEKQAALDALKNALKDTKWDWIYKYFDIPAKVIVSNADSGVIEQFEDDSSADDLSTGLQGVSDIELYESDFGSVLLVAGASASLPGFGAIQAYRDDNLDDVFSLSEQVFHINLAPPVGALDSLDIIQPAHFGAPLFLLYDHSTRQFRAMFDTNGDDIPDGVSPLPAFTIPDPLYARYVQEWLWDDQGAFLRGTEADPVGAAPAQNWDATEPILFDFNFDGQPDQFLPPQPIYDDTLYAPTWGLDPLFGDTTLEVFGRVGSQLQVEILDPNFAPIEIVGLTLVGSTDVHVVPLTRSLAHGERMQIRDTTLEVTSPVFAVPTIFGDVNGDCVVDTADLGLMLAAFGQMGFELPADLNGDTNIDTADLGLLLGEFGDSCPEP